MTFLYEQLMERFPEENVSFFGPCLIIPVQSFREEWREQLRKEGCSVFSQAYNGRIVFMVKKKDSQNSSEAQPSQNTQEQPIPELKPLEWNEETFRLIEKMREEGLGYRRIVQKFREMGFKTTPATLLKKLRERDRKGNCISPNDSLFKEYIGALTVLYPKFRRACALLLREASNLLEDE